MKIASNTFKATSLTYSAFGLFSLMGMVATPAFAAETSAPAPSFDPVVMDIPSPAGSEAGASQSTAGGRARTLSGLEDKVSDSVKNVVKQLSTIDNVNLEDLNTARQAVVKLEVLIDIEKHLAELDKIHNDRGSSKALAVSIPASALSAPPPLPTSASKPRTASSESMSPAPSFASAHTEVSRITGADGHYTATIEGKPIRVGDSLSDGSMVVAITANDVETKSKGGSVKQLKVKGVDEVYGNGTL